MDCKIGYVYVHINKINGKTYIGQTIQKPEKRWGINGKRYLEGSQVKFARAILKYGWDNFEHIILYKGCSAMLDLLEEMYIKKYDSINNGYNSESGGNKNKILSKETIDKIKKYKHTPEQIEKMRIAKLGKKLSKEHIEKCRLSHYKKVRCLENGEIFESVMSAAEYINIDKHAMSACCRGKTHTCGGYHWEYI